MLVMLFLGLTVVALGIAYVFFIRPVLAKQPSLREFYEKEDTLWAALDAKFSGLKQWLTTVLVVVAGFVVTSYDLLSPILASSGVDVTQIGIAKKVPAEMWPLITMGITVMVQIFREIGNRKAAAALVEAAQTGEIPKNVPLPLAPTTDKSVEEDK